MASLGSCFPGRANVLRRELPSLVVLGTCSGAEDDSWATLRFLKMARQGVLQAWMGRKGWLKIG